MRGSRGPRLRVRVATSLAVAAVLVGGVAHVLAAGPPFPESGRGRVVDDARTLVEPLAANRHIAGTQAPAPGGVPGGRIPPAGPPYPEPIVDVTVYDYAEILEPDTEQTVTATIAAIEERTGAEVVVYSQVKPESDSPDEAERDARALIDQWGVGRKGFDDGLAILFDMDERSGSHGQVQLYAAPGYAAAYLSNAERQAVFEDDMLPRLRAGDMDGAVLAAMRRIDAAATPEHAASLTRARQLDGAMGLLVAPLVVVVLGGWAGFHWLRFGRDPEYLDDPSVLMPAPPPDLTAASAAVIMQGRATRLALTTAMLDLASRGEISFADESGRLSKKVGIHVNVPPRDDPQTVRARRRPLSGAEDFALARLQWIGGPGDRSITPDELLRFGTSTPTFDRKLESHVVTKGWFREPPARSTQKWTARGVIEIVAAILVVVGALVIESQGALLIGVGLALGGVITIALGRAMPSRTMAGAMIRAMLLAYQRTLRKTMEQARSMRQVVETRAVPWIETPDQALVWSVALGLREDVARVLARSAEDARSGAAAAHQAWLPAWYGSSSSRGGDGGLGAGTSGLFSSGMVPDFDSMFAAVSTIGDAPSSSGSSRSGGFSGGSSGGGGGGAGGGF